MAFEITSDTIVKILVRRGDEFDRTQTLLSNGELGYSQNIQRLFIGDGVTLGGNPVGNIFHGFVNQKAEYTTIAQAGDTLYELSTNTLYAFDKNVENWTSVGPAFDSNVFIQDGAFRWVLNPNLFQSGFYYSPTDGDFSLAGRPNKIDFNSQYISLCATFDQYDNPIGHFYLGNWGFRPPGFDIKEATLNVVDRMFVHNTEAGFHQIQIHARSADDDNVSTIKAKEGGLYIKAPDNVGLFVSGLNMIDIADNSSINFNCALTGAYTSPNFEFYGASRFHNDSFYDRNVTISGNLSVYGEATYLETNVVTTSALSVVNANANFVALQVSQYGTQANQVIALFEGQAGSIKTTPLVVRDGPFVGINIDRRNFNTTTSNFQVSGKTEFLFRDLSDSFTINMGTGGITFNTTGPLNQSFTNANITPSYASSFRGVTINTNDGNSNNVPLVLQGFGSKMLLMPQAAQNASNPPNPPYNRIIQAGDTAIIAEGSTVNTGALTLATWHNSVSGEGIRIAADGTVSIGSSATGGPYKFSVNGAAKVTGNLRVHGTIQADGDVVAFFTSDKNLKKNISVIDSALDKINLISGVSFDWDTDKQHDHTGHDIGVIAQEIEQVLPEAVITRGTGYKAVKYEKIIPLLIESIKELNAKIK